MKSRRKPAKPKKGASADAPASEGKVKAPRKEAFELAEAGTIHELMEMNGPRVAMWALKCVQKAARGRASLFEQKIALMMIQKSTPSTGRKGEEDADPLPEGTTKEEIHILTRLIEEEKTKRVIPPATQESARAHVSRVDTTYAVRDRAADE